MPDRKWRHDIMRHARHSDASQKHSPIKATGVNNTAHEEMCERLSREICKAHLTRVTFLLLCCCVVVVAVAVALAVVVRGCVRGRGVRVCGTACVVWHAENLPCVDSKRLCVYIQNVPVCAGNMSTVLSSKHYGRQFLFFFFENTPGYAPTISKDKSCSSTHHTHVRYV